MGAYQERTRKVCRASHPCRHSPAFTLCDAQERDMSNPGNHHKINYIELASTDIERTKKFYGKVFGWSFVDYGPEYASFTAHRLRSTTDFIARPRHGSRQRLRP